MLKFGLIGSGIAVLTVLLHALGTAAWLKHLVTRFVGDGEPWGILTSMRILSTTFFALIVLHTVQIAIWAIAYLVLVEVSELASFETALYFSFVTFTTLGYGDITLSEPWRIMSGIQALSGILLVGWTTAFLFALVQRSWKGMAARQEN
jgi:voltage-gated potassium channel Kch